MFVRRNPPQSDLFWAGFLTGAILGGGLGVLLGSEVGKRTRERLEGAVQQVRSRWNGGTEQADVPTEAYSESAETSAEDAS